MRKNGRRFYPLCAFHAKERKRTGFSAFRVKARKESEADTIFMRELLSPKSIHLRRPATGGLQEKLRPKTIRLEI